MPSGGSRSIGVRLIDYAPRERLGWHRHDSASVTLVLRGEIHERSASGVSRGGACAVFLKPAGIEHANRVGDGGARTLTFQLAGEWSEAFGTRGGYAVLRDATLFRAFMEAFERDLDAAALLDRCETALGATRVAGWVDEARRRLDEPGVCDRVACAELARDMGVHPASLARGFRRRFGVSAVGYRRRRRALDAAERVFSTSESLAGVAHRAGYSDQSHMCREFRRELGGSPSFFRSLARERVEFVLSDGACV